MVFELLDVVDLYNFVRYDGYWRADYFRVWMKLFNGDRNKVRAWARLIQHSVEAAFQPKPGLHFGNENGEYHSIGLQTLRLNPNLPSNVVARVSVGERKMWKVMQMAGSIGVHPCEHCAIKHDFVAIGPDDGSGQLTIPQELFQAATHLRYMKDIHSIAGHRAALRFVSRVTYRLYTSPLGSIRDGVLTGPMDTVEQRE